MRKKLKYLNINNKGNNKITELQINDRLSVIKILTIEIKIFLL